MADSTFSAVTWSHFTCNPGSSRLLRSQFVSAWITASWFIHHLGVSERAPYRTDRPPRGWPTRMHQLISSFHEKLYNRGSGHTTPVAPAAPLRHRAFVATAPA